MNERDLVLRRYYRRIRGWLPCSGKMKKQIIREIRSSVEGYLAENPQADFAQIEARFGDPKIIASAYVDDMDTGALLRSLRIRRRIVTMVSCMVLVVLVSWGIYIATSIEHQAKNFPGYIEVGIVEGDYDPANETGIVRYYP